MNKALFVIRNEGQWAHGHLAATVGIDPEEASRRWDAFFGGLVAAVEDVLPVRVHTIDLAAQTPEVKRLLNGDTVVSLDGCYPGHHTFGMSRHFDDQRIRIGYAERPGHAPLEEQIAALPRGTPVTVVDDFIGTGGSMRSLVARFEAEGVRVGRIVTGFKVGSHDFGIPVDAVETHDHVHQFEHGRDFLLGVHPDGGLVLRNGDGLMRAPYLEPFVDVAARCEFTSEQATRFSRTMWGHNLGFWSGFPQVRVGQLNPFARGHLRHVGFGDDQTLVSICEQMLS